MDEQEQHRRRTRRAQHDQAAVGIDVDQAFAARNQRAQPLIEQADIGRAEQHPGQHPRQLGQEEHEDEKPFEQALARGVGARDAPGEGGGQHQRQQGAGNGDRPGWSAGPRRSAGSDSTAAQFSRVSVPGWPGAALQKRAEDDHAQRIDDQERDQHGEAERQHRLQAKDCGVRTASEPARAAGERAFRRCHPLFLEARRLQVRLGFGRPFEEQLRAELVGVGVVRGTAWRWRNAPAPESWA